MKVGPPPNTSYNGPPVVLNIPSIPRSFAGLSGKERNVSCHLYRIRLEDPTTPRSQEEVTFSNLHAAYGLFYSALVKASNQYFRPRDPTSTDEPPPPWWNTDCSKALTAARNKRREWLGSMRLQAPNTPPTIRTTELKTELNRLEAKKKKLCYKLGKESWESHIKSLEDSRDKKKFWAYVKSVANGKSITPNHDIRDENGTTT